MRLKVLLDIAISTGSFVLLLWMLFIDPFTQLIPLENQVQSRLLVYPVLGVILVAVVLNLMLLTRSRSIRTGMFLFQAGLFFLVLADFSLAFRLQLKIGINASFLQVVLLLGYSLLGLYALFILYKGDLFNTTQQVDEEMSFGEKIQPVLAMALAIVLVGELLVYWQFNRVIPQSVVGFSAMVWLLLIARLGVAAGEFELQQYALLFNHSAEPSFLCRSDYRFILINPAILRITGEMDETAFLRKSLSDLLVGKEIPAPGLETVHFESVLRSKDGREIPVEIRLQLVQLGVFRRKVIAGVIHDLTEQKKQQEDMKEAYKRVSQIRKELETLNNELEVRVEEKTGSLTQAYQQLEEQHRLLQSLDNLKSDFVTMVSHELRAPLTNISGGIELVLSGKNQISSGSRTSLMTVQGEILRLTRIVESILDLSALDAGKMPVYPEPIHLENFLPSLQNLIKHYPDKGRFDFQMADNLPVILADPQVLVSVLSYLMDNAVKYAPQGPITISITQQGEKVRFTVLDEGPGIPDQTLPQVFEKFFRADNSDAREVYGRGIGLYMAKRLIEAMNGVISAENRPEGGAQFTIQLPILVDLYEKENSIRG
jgi:PAS domain S-box-containing protein